ncbi:MAG: flavodoxin family protein [Candidatus Bathyarchaeia archaeon]|jgi:multimeric flavodoxin WrbA
MKVLAINGSAIKHWNTAILLNKALEGAASKGAQTELIHLYDLNFKGCTSCYECKLKNGTSFGRCSLKDELSIVLEKIETVDALILGAPIYLGTIPGIMKSFLERLATPYLVYDNESDLVSLFPRKIPTGFIHTMGDNEEHARAMGVENHIRGNEMMLKMIFGSVESLIATDTLHVDNYSKYVMPFDAEEKMKRHKEVFPLDCEKAFEIGVRLTQEKPPRKRGLSNERAILQ